MYPEQSACCQVFSAGSHACMDERNMLSATCVCTVVSQGDAQGQHAMGYRHLYGVDGVTQDYEAAWTYYESMGVPEPQLVPLLLLSMHTTAM